MQKQVLSKVNRVAKDPLVGPIFEIHKKLGHTSYDKIIMLAKQSDSIKLTDVNKVVCQDCIKAKIHDSTHNTRSTPKQTKPVASLHFDTFGPINPPGVEGEKYGVIGKDEATRYKFFSAVKTKDQVKDVVKRVINYLKLTLNLSVLSIITDNGLEYVNTDLSSFLDGLGILHYKSQPYCPKQNGFIEREVRSIKEMARSMLVSSKLPSRLWPFACEFACYIYNRIPTSDGFIHFQELFQKPLNLFNQFAFGTKGFVLDNNQSKTFDAKGLEVYFIGLTEKVNTLKFFSKIKNRVIISSQFQLTDTIGTDENDESLFVEDGNDTLDGGQSQMILLSFPKSSDINSESVTSDNQAESVTPQKENNLASNVQSVSNCFLLLGNQ